MTRSDQPRERAAASEPDPDLLAAIRDELHTRLHGGGPCGAGSAGSMVDAAGNRESWYRAEPGLCSLYQQASGLALGGAAGAGRVLAGRLREQAEKLAQQAEAAGGETSVGMTFGAIAGTTEGIADAVTRWCGVPEDGEGCAT